MNRDPGAHTVTTRGTFLARGRVATGGGSTPTDDGAPRPGRAALDRLRPVDVGPHRRVLTDRLLNATARDLPRVVVPDLIDLDDLLEDL